MNFWMSSHKISRQISHKIPTYDILDTSLWENYE